MTSQFGTPRQTLELLVNALAVDSSRKTKWSAFYATPAYPIGSGPEFVNAAFRFESDLGPADLLAELHELEQQFGRVRRDRWGPRVLDLDLIACGDLVLPDLETYHHWRTLVPQQQREKTPEALILPHPRLQDRSFVLRPLADIAPDWRHPVLGKTIEDLLAARPEEERASVVAI